MENQQVSEEELQVLESQLEEITPPSPADMAASFFTLNEKKLHSLIRNMSIRQLRRMIMAVASFPLKGEYAPKTPEEKNAAYLFNEMCFNRSIMQLQLEMKRADEANKKELEMQQVQESCMQEITNKEGEVSNG